MSAISVMTAEQLEQLVEMVTTRTVKSCFARFGGPTNENEGYVSKRAAARLLGVSTSTIDNYVRQGKLRKYPFTGKTVRFKRAELLQLITK